MAQSNLGRSRTLVAAQLVDATDNAEVVKGFTWETLSSTMGVHTTAFAEPIIGSWMVQGKADHAG